MILNNIEKPFILVIDDTPGLTDIDLGNRATTSVIHPQEVEEPDLKDADLVLVDYRLNKWNEDRVVRFE